MDITDRANNQWTFLLLLSLAGMTFFLPILISPVLCRTLTHEPAATRQTDFTHAECAYSERSQHFEIYDKAIHGVEKLPRSSRPSLVMMLWTPCILSFMALAVKIPYLTWYHFRGSFGFNVDAIVNEIQDNRRRGDEERSQLLKRTIQSLAVLLRNGGNSVSLLLILIRKTISTFLSLAFFITIHLGINPFAYVTGNMYPEQTLGALRSHSNCTYTLYGDQIHTVICIYPANLILQKMFIFLEVYSACLTLANLCDLFMWARILCLPDTLQRKLPDFIHTWEEMAGSQKANSKVDNDFALYLGFDGYLLLITVNQRLGELAWAEVGMMLWYEYQNMNKNESHIRTDGTYVDNLFQGANGGAGSENKDNTMTETGDTTDSHVYESTNTIQREFI